MLKGIDETLSSKLDFVCFKVCVQKSEEDALIFELFEFVENFHIFKFLQCKKVKLALICINEVNFQDI